MMILSFFEAVDVLPYVESSSLLSDGTEIVLTEEEQTSLEAQVFQMLENSRTLPAFGVMFGDMFQDYISQGNFVSLKFGKVLELSGLPFDELVFKVDSQAQGFDLVRGMNGVFQGRCIHVDLMGSDMQEFSTFVEGIVEQHKTEIPQEDTELPDNQLQEDESLIDGEETEAPEEVEGRLEDAENVADSSNDLSEESVSEEA